MKVKQVNNLTGKVLGRCRDRERICFQDTCNEIAIRSHLLQKNGIVNEITKSSHVYSVRYVSYPNQHYTIRREGINEAFTFKGFCNLHDTQVFKEIEGKNTDFNTYHSNLLLSYRAILKERRDKEVMIEFYEKIINSSELKNYYDNDQLNTGYAAEEELSWDIDFLIESLNKDLVNGTENFEFKVLDIPRIDVCASALYSLISLQETFNLKTNPKDSFDRDLIPCIIVNIFPYNENFTRIVFGYHKLTKAQCELDLMKFFVEDQVLVKKHINDLLIKKIATWICSEEFYLSNIKDRKEEMIKQMNYFTKRNQFSSEEVKFSLF